MGKKFYKFGRALCSIFFMPLLRMKIVGKENLNYEGRMILACNHFRLKDPIIVACADKKHKIRFMAKCELWNSKLLTPILNAAGAFPVDREKKDLKSLITATNVLKEEGVLGIFPEGKRNFVDGWEVDEFLDGVCFIANKANSDIIPMCLATVPKLFKRNKLVIGERFHVADYFEEGKSKTENIHNATVKLREAVVALRDRE